MNRKKLLALALALVLALISTGVIACAQSLDVTATPSASAEAESTSAPVETETSNIIVEDAPPADTPAAPAAAETVKESTTAEEPAKEPAQTGENAEQPAQANENAEQPAQANENAEQPAEEITPKSVVITVSYDTETVQFGSVVTLTAALTGFDGLEYAAVWQCAAADSEGHVIGEWQDVEAGTLTYAYTLAEDNLLTAWRLCVTVDK